MIPEIGAEQLFLPDPWPVSDHKQRRRLLGLGLHYDQPWAWGYLCRECGAVVFGVYSIGVDEYLLGIVCPGCEGILQLYERAELGR